MSDQFHDLLTTRKGEFAEPIVNRHIQRMGFIPYRPTIQNVAHPIDHVWFSLSKRTMVIGDSKAKARREFYPDTGIDHRCFLDYTFISRRYQLPCYLVFVDEKDGIIYGERLEVLYLTRRVRGQENRVLIYPRVEHTQPNGIDYFIIYFPLSAMKTIGRLSESERAELVRLSSRNDKFDQEPRFQF